MWKRRTKTAVPTALARRLYDGHWNAGHDPPKPLMDLLQKGAHYNPRRTQLVTV